MMDLRLVVLSVALCHAAGTPTDAVYLKVQGNNFSYGDQLVFLSGVNQPWLSYGADFGNNQSNGAYCSLKDDYLKPVAAAGGNSIRFWLFVEGDAIPAWGSDGTVVGTDGANSLAEDMRKYVRTAASMNILVFFVLWNGALMRNQKVKNMLTEGSGKSLQSFIDKALTPLVTALKDEPGIGGWEIINEPEGSVIANVKDPESCFDTTPLNGQGPGWAGTAIPMKSLQRFVNWQASAIHDADPKALVTVGSWNAKANEEWDGFRNYWKDQCLVKAGGKDNGVLDFYQIHSYPNGDKFDDESPFSRNRTASAYVLDKPLVIGEFPANDNNGGFTDTQLYKYAYTHAFQGAWGWAINDKPSLANLVPGLQALKGETGVALKVGGDAPPDTCSCSDVAPDPQYTCAQQASWGKCSQSFMKGHCCKSCFACQGCNGIVALV